MPWYQRWANTFQSERLDDDLETELQYHLDETVDQLVEGGMAKQDALREAKRRLGNYGAHKEQTRDMNILQWLDTVSTDLRYAVRQLRLNPGFTAVAVLSLALGIGANTAIFQLVDAICLRMLPVRNPHELVSIDFAPKSARSGYWSGRSATMTYGRWEQIRAQQQAFSGVLAWSASRFNLAAGGESRFAEGVFVSGDFFSSLGVNPILGRTIVEQDDTAACNAGAVISHAFWQREFGGDPGVIGRQVTLYGHSFPIIGVTPPSFFGVEVGSRYDLAVPLCTDRLLAEDGKGRIALSSAWWLSAMGRLKPGWTAASARAHLQTLSPGIMTATLPPEYDSGLAKRFLVNKLDVAEAGTGISGLRKQYELSLWLLMAITGLVLLIACANLANLLLARAAVREREIAVRLAIGASRWRVLRQLLTESLLLAAAGAAAGCALAVTLSRALVSFISTSDTPVTVDVGTDWRVLAFAAALAVLTCVLFGLLPALRATYLPPVSAMRSGGRSMTAGRERFGIRRALVSAQVALSLVLLIGAMLFVRSFQKLASTDAGFQSEGVLALNIDFAKAAVPKERRLAFCHEISERLSSLPGVLSAAQVGSTPVSGSGWDQNVGPDGTQATGSGKAALFNRVAPGYFRTMETRLVAGRDFNDRDTLASPKVAIVNEMFTQRFFDGANPIGRTFRIDARAGKPEPLFQIVGLVANTKYYQLREDFKPIAFFPIAQDEGPDTGATFVLRIGGSPSSGIEGAKATIAEFGPATGLEFRPFSAQIKESLSRES